VNFNKINTVLGILFGTKLLSDLTLMHRHSPYRISSILRDRCIVLLGVRNIIKLEQADAEHYNFDCCVESLTKWFRKEDPATHA